MTDAMEPEAGNEDIKAKMREALERKQSNDRVAEVNKHEKGKAPSAHGPLGGKREFRRKSG